MPPLELVIFWLLFGLVTLSLLLFLLASFRATCPNDAPRRTEELQLNTLCTGDVLGVGYRHPFGWFVKAWSGSMWSHTGIVWKDPKDAQIYVMEAAMYQAPYRGVFKIPILEWLRINRKSHLGLARLKGKALDSELLNAAFEARQQHLELESYNWRWYRLLFRTPYYETTRTKYTCYEIVVTLLQDVGVIRKLYTCSSYFPYHIMQSQIHTTQDYNYETAVLLDVRTTLQLLEAEGGLKNRSGGCSLTSC